MNTKPINLKLTTKSAKVLETATIRFLKRNGINFDLEGVVKDYNLIIKPDATEIRKEGVYEVTPTHIAYSDDFKVVAFMFKSNEFSNIEMCISYFDTTYDNIGKSFNTKPIEANNIPFLKGEIVAVDSNLQEALLYGEDLSMIKNTVYLLIANQTKEVVAFAYDLPDLVKFGSLINIKKNTIDLIDIKKVLDKHDVSIKMMTSKTFEKLKKKNNYKHNGDEIYYS